MKQLFKLFPAILMLAAISFAGCGEKAGDKGGDKKGDDAKSETKDKGASTTPSTTAPVADAAPAKFVATKVSLPNMSWS
ncbi:MAG: hypothetical protein P8J33_07240 [Pirellulaceae bacterium]|nr:hypothetical protein [Pirellulaceae bacterium]